MACSSGFNIFSSENNNGAAPAAAGAYQYTT